MRGVAIILSVAARLPYSMILILAVFLFGSPMLLSLDATQSWPLQNRATDHRAAASGAAPPVAHVVFVVRDAGETYALLPVLRRLRMEGRITASGIVTGGGTAPSSIVSEPGVSTLASLNVTNTSDLQDRNAKLPAGAVHRILALTKPTVLITGVVSAVQLQLAREALALPHVRLVAGYDEGLSTADDAAAWPNVALRSGSIRELWVVATRIASLHARHAASWQTVVTTGSPTLEGWPAAVKTYGAARLARLRKEAFGVTTTKSPVVVYFGG